MKAVEEVVKALLGKYFQEDNVLPLWKDIKNRYDEPHRHYHTWRHIEKMVRLLLDFNPKVRNLDALLFAILYHDVIYESTRNDNEEASADYAAKTLSNSTFPDISIVKSHILATKKHELSEDSDTNVLLDLDLAILAAPTEEFMEYEANIRKEYSKYPRLVYRAGRRKVLLKFLSKPIYKTPMFQNAFEDKARKNIEELALS